MNNMFEGANAFRASDYDALLLGWSVLTLQPDITFRAPPTTYCSGETGRNILTNATNNWTISGDSGPSCPLPFVTTWDAGTGGTISLPIIQGSYDVDTNNDGTFDRINQTGSLNVYLSAGTHTIRIRPNTAYNPEKNLVIEFTRGGTPEKLASINKWGDIIWTTMVNAFRDCLNLTIADDAGVPDLTQVTNISHMFRFATNFTGDLSAWNVSNVTGMRFIFNGASSFNSDLSAWDVSKVTYYGDLFNGASSFNSDLSSWNVAGVTNMERMFSNATSFSSENYDALLSSWSSLPGLISGITFGAPPVGYCIDGQAGRGILTGTHSWDITGDEGLTCVFVTTWNTQEGDTGSSSIRLPILGGHYDIDVGNDGTFEYTKNAKAVRVHFDNPGIYTIAIRPSTSNINNQLQIKYDNNSDAQKLTSIDNWGSLIVWTSMENAFKGCSNLTIADDAGEPNLTMVTNMNSMFSGITSFNSDLSTWNVSNVTGMSSMFSGITNFNSDLSIWNVSNVTDMNSMFSGITNFNSNLSTWNVSNVIDMNSMFSGITSFNSDLSTWNVSNVIDMNSMFSGVISFNSNLSTWNVSNVIDMNSMFSGITSFNSDLSTWNVSNVTDMNSMFSGVMSFNSNLSTWNVSNVIDMNSMFSGVMSFNSNLSTWNVSNVTDMNSMFSGITSFNSDLSTWNVSNVTDMTNMLSGAISFTDYNYEKLLSGWSKLTLQNNVDFGAPPASYCAGKTGRDVLTSAPHNWRITGDMESCSNLAISINIFLQGSYDTTTSIMGDGLRVAGIIPTTSPYGGVATIEDIVLNVTGDDAIVDWVEVSLHDPNNVSIVISTTSALLQRDGGVVALDGSSALQIDGIAGNYKVSINHRNHIPVITDAAQSLSTTETAIDFTNDLTIVTGGSNAMAEVATGIYALFSGDVNGNNQVQVDDYNAAIQHVGRGGYLTSDVDMNGELQVSDINFVLKTLGKGAQF